MALANRFDSVAGGQATELDQHVLLEFLRAVAPKVWCIGCRAYGIGYWG